jgi:hypothetical protein
MLHRGVVALVFTTLVTVRRLSQTAGRLLDYTNAEL